jgi:hypothetical protein
MKRPSQLLGLLALLFILAGGFFHLAAQQTVKPLLGPGGFNNPDGFLEFKADGVADHLSQGARGRELFLNVRRQPDGRYATFAGVLETSPFKAAAYMAIPVMGPVPSRQPSFSGQLEPGAASVHLQCTVNGLRLELLSAVNLEFYERVISISPEWCSGPVKLVTQVNDPTVQVGVGMPVEIGVWRYAAQRPTGYAVAAIFMGGLLSLVVLPFLGGGSASPLQRMGAAALYLGTVGCTLYLVAYVSGSPLTTKILTPLMILAPAVVQVLSRRKWQWDAPALRAWFLGVGASMLLFAMLAAVLPLHAGAWFPNSAFYPVAWSTDNHLPTYMAKFVQLLGAGHPPPLGPWSITDRGFLPAGVVLLGLQVTELAGIRGPGGADYVLLHALQFGLLSITLPVLLLWASQDAGVHRLSPRREVATLVFLLTMPFMVFNLFYAWPKLFSAVCVLLMVVVLTDSAAAQARPAMNLVKAAALAGMAVVSHAASLLALPLVLLAWINVWRRQRSVGWAAAAISGATHIRVHWRPWLLGLSTFMLIVLGHNQLAAKTSYAATFALTGEGVFGLDFAGVVQAVRNHYGALTLHQWWGHKMDGFKTLIYAFEPYHYYNAACRTHGWLDCVRAAQFSSVVPSLGVTVLLAAAARIVQGRGEQLQMSAQLSQALAQASVVGMLLIVLSFQFVPVVHHIPYAFILAVVLPALRAVTSLPTTWLAALLLTNAVVFMVVWVLGPLYVWRSLGMG